MLFMRYNKILIIPDRSFFYSPFNLGRFFCINLYYQNIATALLSHLSLENPLRAQLIVRKPAYVPGLEFSCIAQRVVASQQSRVK